MIREDFVPQVVGRLLPALSIATGAEALDGENSVVAALLTPPGVRKVSRRFKATPSIGLDHTSFKEIAQASDETFE